MKVTNTKTETTMYDTNGKKVSIVKQEILEVDTTRHLLNREEGKQLSEKVTVYKTDLTNAQAIKNQLEKTQGSKKGQKIFRDMADLIMIVEKPRNSDSITMDINFAISSFTSVSKPTATHVIFEAANTIYESDTHIKQKMSSKKHKKKY